MSSVNTVLLSVLVSGYGVGHGDIIIHGNLRQLKFVAYYTKSVTVSCEFIIGYRHLRCRLASGEGIVTVGVTLSRCVCVSAETRLHAALILAAKVMRCIHCSLLGPSYLCLL